MLSATQDEQEGGIQQEPPRPATPAKIFAYVSFSKERETFSFVASALLNHTAVNRFTTQVPSGAPP